MTNQNNTLTGEIDDPLDGAALEDGAALSLSGGGFKAAMYHVGALTRMNELGLLPELQRVSSVSGGSIVAGLLALRWKQLGFTKGVRKTAANFVDVVAQPLVDYCGTQGVDVPAGLAGILLPFRSASDGLRESYDKHLYDGANLQDFIDEASGPRFVINATNLQLNSLWRFSRAYAADHRVGAVMEPDFKVSHIVAASSGFPPFFSPVILDLAGEKVVPLGGEDRHVPAFMRRVELGDGGLYDNMGLEAVWKRYKTLLVCNAGDPNAENQNPPDDWYHQFMRTISFIHRQAENNRVRWLMSMAKANARKLAYFALRSSPSVFAAPGLDVIELDKASAASAREEPVRLWKMEPKILKRLVHHGYAMADASIRRWYLGGGVIMPNTPPAQFPVVKLKGKPI